MPLLVTDLCVKAKELIPGVGVGWGSRKNTQR